MRQKKGKKKKQGMVQSAFQKIFPFLYSIKATLALCAGITIAFFLLSENGFLVGLATVSLFSFSLQNFWNILLYVFVHNSFVHLIANVSSILVFGVLVERTIGSRHALAVLFISATISAIAFSVLFPSFSLFGASAAASGLIGAGFATKPKATIIAAVCLTALVVFAVKPAAFQFFEAHKATIAEQIQKTEGQKAIAMQQGDQQKAEQLEQKAVSMKHYLDVLRVQELHAFSTGIASTAHAFGALAGLFYTLLLAAKNKNALLTFAALSKKRFFTKKKGNIF